MGSWDVYDYAYEDRFATPSCLPPVVKRRWDTVKWKATRFLRKWAPRLEKYLRALEERRAPKRYARWRSQQDKRWQARLPGKIERPAISINAQTADQLQSRFFQLPLELREEIYDYIFDGGIVRLDVQEKVDGKVVRNKEPYRLRNLEPQQCLAILQACKRTYVEASHLLYTTNTFIFPDLTTFVCFERLVPSPHWHRIKSICIAWDYDEVDFDFQYSLLPCPTNEQTWQDVCLSIMKMKGLGLLTVNLNTVQTDPYKDGDVELSQPLREITGPALLHLYVYGERKALTGRCGCGCGRAEGFHGSGPWNVSGPEDDSE